ncbi:PEGA domain-containing protein [Candidatus Woesearchaeota archaeon]|nr:PEGA domain-containing protein [Candidatus Woesearchaeota archaeon]
MKYRLTTVARTCLVAALLLGFFLSLSTCSPEAKEQVTGGTSVETVSVLHVKVQNESGGVLDGAEVYINGQYKGKTSKYGESAGIETVILESEDNELVVKKEGYFSSAPTSVSVAKAEQRLTVVLEQETSVVLVVVKDVYGRVLEGVVVSLSKSGVVERSSQEKKKTQLTDDDGVAKFTKVADGWYELAVLKEGYFSKQNDVKVDFARQKETRTTVIIEKLPQITVEVVDGHDTPLEEAEVSFFTRKEYNLPGASPSHVKYTRADGVVRFTDVEFDETYVIVVKKEGFLAETEEKKVINSDEVLTVRLETE